ncbi:MAG: hypothetical protein F2817_06155, partial [Actinobacteria bacterium]|nr:hypothetical protein [Actinomycetota bacterium]
MSWLTVVLGLAPALLLIAVLLLGRYPGEATLSRLRRGRRPRRRALPRTHLGVARRAVAVPPRGGRLIGAGVASRPPPRRDVGRRTSC